MPVTRFRDRALRTRRPGGILRGHQPNEHADRVPGATGPVTDLNDKPEPGERGDPTQTAQATHDTRIFAVERYLLDLLIQSSLPVQDLLDRFVICVERGLEPWLLEPLLPKPGVMRSRPRGSLNRPDRDAAAASRAVASLTSGRPGYLPLHERDRVRFPARSKES